VADPRIALGLPVGLPNWAANRQKPRRWCWLFHRTFWFSNDFGMWYVSGRDSFEVYCTLCGDCWTERAAKEGK